MERKAADYGSDGIPCTAWKPASQQVTERLLGYSGVTPDMGVRKGLMAIEPIELPDDMVAKLGPTARAVYERQEAWVASPAYGGRRTIE